MLPPSSSPPEYTVSELSLALKKFVETGFSTVRVRGEVSGLKRHTSGHMYFALKDETAVLDGVCWRGTAQGMSFPLQEGLQVIACGRLTTYPGRSKYQIVVERVEPAGEGALLKLLEERKRRLTAEGLFEESRKKSLPFLPRLIGIITSPTGAVIRDMLHRLADRFPVPVLLWPVAVQGEGAAAQVAAAIRGFNTLPSGPDLLIVARGGGSLEDLWAFNEEEVVRAAAESRIPLISAIGHETDVTLLDFAADKRAPTPTAAAEFAVPLRSHVAQTLAQYHGRLTARIHHLLSLDGSRLEALRRGLPPLKTWLEDIEQKIDDYAERLLTASSRVIDKQELLLTSFSRQLCPAFTNFVGKTTHKVDILFQLLDSYSYTHTLRRGFSFVTTLDQTLLPSKAKASSVERVELHFYDGAIEATLLKMPTR